MTDGNDPVYPSTAAWSSALTKRELFAAMAMQGLLASPVEATVQSFAEASVKTADALIAELNKEQPHD